MAGQQRQRAEVVKDFVGMDYKGEAGFDYAAAEKKVMPLSALTPFAGRDAWLCKVRVLERAPVRKYSSPKGTGLVMSVTIIDENKTAMRATVFRDGVEKFHRVLTEGSVVYIGKGQVRSANKQFTSIPHDYEVVLNDDSIVQPVRDGDAAEDAIPTATTANYIRLSEIRGRMVGSIVDVKACLVSVGQISEVLQRSTGQTLRKRTVQIADTSGADGVKEGTLCELTLWEDAARDVPNTVKPGQTVTMHSLKVSHYKGRDGEFAATPAFQLSALRDAFVDYKANDEELAVWWAEVGKDAAARGKLHEISRLPGRDGGDFIDGIGGRMGGFRSSLKEAKELGRGEKPDWVNIRGTVMGFQEKEGSQLYYDACPNMVPGLDGQGKRQCGKKIDNFTSGHAQCQKCDMAVKEVQPRYIASVRVADHSSEAWVTFFDDAGMEFFGCTASTLKASPEKAEALKQSMQGQPVTMTVKCKQEVTPDGDMRMKYVAASAMADRPGQKRCQVIRHASDWAADCRNMLRDLERYAAGDASAVQVP